MPMLQIGKRYIHPQDGLIEIRSGAFAIDGRISNYWDWIVVATGKKKSGYGESWPLASETHNAKLTLTEVKRRVAQIEATAHDPEVAHRMEDELHHDVLTAIANGKHTASAEKLAAAALKTQDLDFSRWYA